METGTWKVKVGLAQMLKGGVSWMSSPGACQVAEAAGACGVMALNESQGRYPKSRRSSACPTLLLSKRLSRLYRFLSWRNAVSGIL
jgi:hypothetical protein